ncbi:MAG: ABC transporter ATP-binding protein [Candidatus Hydrogenedens sp.]|nr:ABC transporter ATP-binding protein [Candidatus Hydrogenedentota bacterium]NLF56377.1 ABC transporter ATP-binding protein [Candidatus Hydrogenedens sp.]
MALLTVEGLRTSFHLRDGVVRAVDGVSFSIGSGETLGVVGESGCGKSVTFYSLLGLLPMPPARVGGGTAFFGGMDLLKASPAELRRVRGRRIGMVFQDPMTALNPYMTVGDQVAEPLRVHGGMGRAEARRRAVEALESVGISDAAGRLDAHPHAFSGGMRQRVMIAMALIARPDLLVADEPTTALDVTVQAQILELLRTLQRERGMAVALITHDLGVVAGNCRRVLVMYAGRVVESAGVEALFARPRHPYTRALMASMPAANPPGAPLRGIPGRPPDLARLPAGCAFAPRCPQAAPVCLKADCVLRETAPGHATACVRMLSGEIG